MPYNTMRTKYQKPRERKKGGRKNKIKIGLQIFAAKACHDMHGGGNLGANLIKAYSRDHSGGKQKVTP